MQAIFNPQQVEKEAQADWAARDVYRVREDGDERHSNKERGKFYACSMLPYPSGKLHMGHVRNYTINDMLTRHLRMKGHKVLMPMGWDAFGLPAENAALKNGLSPAAWTHSNIAYMKKQMQAMGLAVDWSRELATCEPSYYKWNQWLFLQMLKSDAPDGRKMAYRKTQLVNWDPMDQTVLANEQVIDGRGWRTGALVEKREIPGYYLNITAYAPELLDHVQLGNPRATLTDWPDKVRLMQENWIGKSEGLRFAFTHGIPGADGSLIQDGKLYVFTTRADTLMGVTFCAVAPEHPLALHAAASNPQLAAFIESCKKGGTTEAELALREKEGMPTGLFVTHPLTGARVEVWVGNYVLMGYGDGAVMGVPAHDERDFAFAKKYGIPIVQVIADRRGGDSIFSTDCWQDWYATKDFAVCINSGPLNGLGHQDAVNKVAELLAAKGLGEKKTTWRLRDWGISRQRYWGTPIPIIHCESCGPVPVPEQDLPVVLPQDLVPDGSGNPLNKCESFLKVDCPCCGKPARRETDTMDTFVDSSWYFLRYCNPGNTGAMADAATQYWMQGGMDQYIGGIEHAILHLLYARFWTKLMRDLGLIQIDEPFKRLLCQGMVLNQIYSRRNDKGGIEYFWPHDVEPVHDAAGKVVGARLKNAVGDWPAGAAIEAQGVGTMSKSKNNGVDPKDIIDRYGADTARLYMMFTAPPEATLEWNDAAVEGSFRFLRRVWAFAEKHQAAIQAGRGVDRSRPVAFGKAAQSLRREMHSVLKQAHYDYERMQYNTVVSALMKMLNLLEDAPLGDSAEDRAALAECVSILLRVLYPVCPHIACVLWRDLGYGVGSAAGDATGHGAEHKVSCGDLLDAAWPEVDELALLRDEIELVLQINGKLRGSLLLPAAASKDEIERAALAHEAVSRQAQGAAPKKVVLVPGRLVNVVL